MPARPPCGLYPTVTRQTSVYIAKRVKVEFGSLTHQQPSLQAVARTLLAGVLPAGVFIDLAANVVALDVARTFWEKATILHAEHYRPEHLDPLTDVALHKSRYFASGWAHYDTAKPGTLTLVPPRFRWAALGEDYATMRPMFMTAPPPFADLMRQLAQAEHALNLLKGAAA